MPKNVDKVDIEDVPVVDDALLDGGAELVEVPAVTLPAGGTVSAKRALGGKEPTVFKWKLIGTSQQTALTLFKAVEREEVDAQLERLRKEGYYTNLRIVEAETKVDQPIQPHGTKKQAPRRERKDKEIRPSAGRKAVARRSSPPVAPPRRTAASKSALRTATKATKKKSTGSTTGPRRKSKRK